MSYIFSNPSYVTTGIVYTSVQNVTLTGNANNLSIPNIEGSVLIRIASTGNYSLTGLVNPSVADARQIFILNVGSNNIIFKDNSASSLAENRFILGADKTVQADEGIAFVYDTINQRWRSYGINI